MVERRIDIAKIKGNDSDPSLSAALIRQSESVVTIPFSFEGENIKRLGIYPSIYQPFLNEVPQADPERTRE